MKKLWISILVVLTAIGFAGCIYNGQNKAPIISFGDSNYSFTTPDDTGTGTSYKSMIVYDLAVLSLTGLPILVHDS